MSAQDTTRGQQASSAALALLITSKPLKLGLFAGWSFSAGFPGVESSNTDASQP
ncbi:hypothetical protein ACHQM5_026115 [Ranunculus cassubicifolius]